MRRGGPKEAVLSARLSAVTKMVEKGSVVCDTGCDHGFVSIWLVQKRISPRVIAMDVNRGPLLAAEEHIRERGLEGYIETRLSDGLDALEKGEADTLICAGMGGRLMIKILEGGREKASCMKTLILQPQSQIPEVRAYLREREYTVAGENMILEDGKYYTVLKACPAAGENRNAPESGKTKQENTARRQRVEDRYGPCLLSGRHPVLLQFLKREENEAAEIIKRMDAFGSRGERQLLKKKELLTLLEDIRYALSFYYEL